MKLVNNNLSPLPFYDDITLQNHRKDYAFGQICPLITYRNMLLPFQIVLDKNITAIGPVYLVDYNTNKSINITTSIKENGLVLKAYADFTVLKYPGILPINEIKYEGLYYLRIQLSKSGVPYNIVSDIFSVTNRIDDCLKLEYRNTQNFELKNGMVDFSDSFKFICYLPTQVGKPEYSFEEEAEERLGYSFVESQVSKKIYKFAFFAPEYLCDALRIVRLCDTKKITSKSQEYDLTAFEIEVEWEEQGDIASVECQFETDTVIATIGGYEPELLGGDFNNDFNVDFYNRGESLPICYINIDISNGYIQAQIAPVSDITVTTVWKRTDDPTEYVGTNVINAGSTELVNADNFDEIFVRASLSPVADSTYRYVIQYKDL